MKPILQQPPARDILSGLNESQITAVSESLSAHCLVVAGAGCGKTAVLTRRLAFCIGHSCSPDRILALTFTRKAAVEMRERMSALSGPHDGEEHPFITTFHGFCLAVLRENLFGRYNAERVGVDVRGKHLTSDERLRLLAAVSDRDDRLILGVDLFGLDRLLAQRAVDNHRAVEIDREQRMVVEKIAARFAGEKRRLRFWEFSDLIHGTVRLFETCPDVAEWYSHKYRHLLVDEFQDTNPLQIKLLKILAGGGARVFCVGDDDQAIYGFRGADPGGIMRFEEEFPNARILKLQTNYRNRPAILRTANEIFKHKPAKFRKVLVSGKYPAARREAGTKPVKRSFDDEQRAVLWMCREMEKLAKTIPIEKTCLLFRLNASMDRIGSILGSTLHNSSLPCMMTVHGSKGLEFPVVFLWDMEEGIFPHYKFRKKTGLRALTTALSGIIPFLSSNNDLSPNLDEERRLFYVAVTRAEERLYLINLRKRIVGDRTRICIPSRYLKLV